MRGGRGRDGVAGLIEAVPGTRRNAVAGVFRQKLTRRPGTICRAAPAPAAPSRTLRQQKKERPHEDLT